MSATPHSINPAVEQNTLYSPETDHDDDVPAARYDQPGKSILEDFVTDALFLTLLLGFGALTGSVSYLSTGLHAVACTTAIILLFIAPNTKTLREAYIACVCICSSLGGLADVLCVVQLLCRALRQEKDEPVAFATGVSIANPIILATIFAAHTTSFIAAVWRTRRASWDLDIKPHIASLGVFTAASCVYVIWIVDIRRLTVEQAPHLFCALALLAGPISNLAVMFTKTPVVLWAWWISACALSVHFIVLLSNVSILFGDPDFVGSTFFAHHYSRPFARFQGVGLITVAVASGAHRITSTAPIFSFPEFNELVYKTMLKTPAMYVGVEPFAAFLVALLQAAGTSLPLACSVAALLGDNTPTYSRFAILLYASTLSARLWTLASSTQFIMFVSTHVIGITMDLVIMILFWFAVEWSSARVLVVLTVAAVSALLNCLCIGHSVAQYVKMTKLKEKNM